VKPSRKTPILLASVIAVPLLLQGCEFPKMETTQLGPRGTGMEQVTNPRLMQAMAQIPPSAYTLDSRDGPRASEVYENVQVLGDISADEFNLLMANITEWVSPKEGCNYCHNPANLASDEVYTKVVSRKMIEMTRNINVNWQSHVKATGVTCWTCHRGNAIPQNVWSVDANAGRMSTIWGNTHGQNRPSPAVAYASLPYDPFSNYLTGTQSSRVTPTQIHPSPDHVVSIQKTEASYGLMMHMSQSLGVNCTFCHNTQNFGSWTNSREQRAGAWYGIRMIQDSNDNYIAPLQTVFPAHKLGPAGDVLKINCTTCHQGQNKPMGGVSMLAENPSLAELPSAPEQSRLAAATDRVAAAISDRVAAARNAVSENGEETATDAPAQ
jgi:photosynthetic reaction center cytochrome c subunit